MGSRGCAARTHGKIGALSLASQVQLLVCRFCPREGKTTHIRDKVPQADTEHSANRHQEARMTHVRPYSPDDRVFVLGLAARLTIGMPPWRDPKRCISAVQSWIAGSISQHGNATMVFVAEDEHGERLGFATVTHETHFTGERQASIGELVTSEAAEGHGVGRALIEACEQWARSQGDRVL